MSISPDLARRASRVAAISAVTALLAACASAGATGGAGVRTPGGTRMAEAAPVVTDPAPIVSGTMRRYQIRGRWYQPEEQPNYDQVGLASWYGDQFNGRPTATGERFDMHALTAAHKTLPLPGLVEVTNLANGRRIVARVNDRGPFAENRIIDLSRGSADALGMLSAGVGEVRVRYLGRAPRLGGGTRLDYAAVEASARADGLRGPVPYSQVAAETPAPAPTTTSAAIVAPVVSPTPVDLRPALPSAAPAAGLWVQAAAFDDPRRARREAERLGGSARVDQAGAGWRVLVGPWPDTAAAERSRRAVVSRGYPEALLISGG